tara:strand:- start:21 stop:131 length:111 start_codon:yes stop_codon:yes gene_type:complete
MTNYDLANDADIDAIRAKLKRVLEILQYNDLGDDDD